MICQIYNYNSRCTPYIDVPALYFNNGSYDENKGTIKIGSFATQMLYCLINVMKARSNNDQNKKNIYYTIISHFIEMKNYYFDKTKKTIFDKSLFQEFILTCTGSTHTFQMEKAIRRDKKLKAGKRITWNYNPAKDKNTDAKFSFKNSSGNFITNEKNKQINLLSNIDGDNDGEIDDVEEEESEESKSETNSI